jgi:hypothetical protein
VSPERLAAEEEQRHAEHVVGVRLLHGGLEVARARAGEVGEIALARAGAADLVQQRSDLGGEVELEPVVEEARVRLAREGAEAALLLREQAADQRGPRVVDLARAADAKAAAPVRPAPCVEVGVAGLPLRVLAALALALDAELEGDPAQGDRVLLRQRERRLRGEVREGALVVEVELQLFRGRLLLDPWGRI